MPAKSVAQQRLMAMAEHNPSKVFSKNKGVLKMSKEDLHDFASTKTSNLPQHKRGTGGGGGSPCKIRKREGGMGDMCTDEDEE